MVIIVNYKNYKFGRDSVQLSKKIERNLGKIIVCPSSLDLLQVKKETGLKVFAQHVSGKDKGRNTGWLTVDGLKEVGIGGTLVNHSEHKIQVKEIDQILVKCSALNLKAIVCCGSLKEVKQIMKLTFKPWAIAYEDPKLVGSGLPITKFKTRRVRKFASMLIGSGVLPLCGAGISSARDVKAAKSLGCKGVLISSAIAKSKSPEQLLQKLRGLNG
tara:strand:- start:3333 stop:3977 length:645 start_codon:yes stop_codon:yes gene_type:complete